MNVGQIRFFVGTVRLGSFSGVAKEQGVTIQAVSKAIINLEQELGSELFVRESRSGVSPTAFGRAFYEKARKALASFDELDDFAKSYTASLGGNAVRLAVDAPHFKTHERFCAGMSSYLGRRFGMQIVMGIASGEDGVERLRSGDIDGLVTLGPLRRAGVDRMQVGVVPPGLVMCSDHELAAQRSVALEDAVRYPLCVTPHFEGVNRVFDAMFERLGKRPQMLTLECEADFADAILNRQALTPCVAIGEFVESFPSTVMRPVRSEDALPIPVGIDMLHGSTSSQVAEFAAKIKGRAVL